MWCCRNDWFRVVATLTDKQSLSLSDPTSGIPESPALASVVTCTHVHNNKNKMLFFKKESSVAFYCLPVWLLVLFFVFFFLIWYQGLRQRLLLSRQICYIPALLPIVFFFSWPMKKELANRKLSNNTYLCHKPECAIAFWFFQVILRLQSVVQGGCFVLDRASLHSISWTWLQPTSASA